MFGDSNTWFRDASYTQLGQTGAVTPWMKIAGPTDGKCYGDHANTMNQAKTAAAALKTSTGAPMYDLTAYDNFVLYSPHNGWQTGSDCNGYAGWAYIGAQNTWLNGYMDRRATVHEQGHNYGLYHAHSHVCGNGMGGRCSWSDYGDDYDAMGASSYNGHFSGATKQSLGWMTGRLATITGTSTVTLAPMTTDAVATTAAVIPAGGSRSYWLEYRQAVQGDAWLPPNATDGVQIRVQDSSLNGNTYDPGVNLIDARPADGMGTDTATVRSGSSWTTPEGHKISVGTLSTTGAPVTVTAPTCPDTALEPDNTAGAAKTVAMDTTVRRGFCTDADEDWVKFSATAGTKYRFETDTLATGVDTALTLYQGDGTTLVSENNDSGDIPFASAIEFTPTASGTYVLRARNLGTSFGPSAQYDLKASVFVDPVPAVTARTPGINATGAPATGPPTSGSSTRASP